MSQRAQEMLGQPLLDHASLDLGRTLDQAGTLTYVLRQSFRYDYEAPLFDLQHRLVVVPRARHGNARRLWHRVDVSAGDAQVRDRRDGRGNRVTDVAVPVLHDRVSFDIVAVVERVGAWRDARVPVAALHDPRLLRPTRLTAADDAIRTLARDLAGGVGAPGPQFGLEFATRATRLVHKLVTYEYGVTSTATTAAQALALGRGVCQDHAHLMLALCRSAGVPARYVSGHLLGEGGTHAWVEVVMPAPLTVAAPVAGRDSSAPRWARAVAFDPCNGCPADARYLTVATGRDYLDVAPTSGSYRGDARGSLTTSKQVGLTAAA